MGLSRCILTVLMRSLRSLVASYLESECTGCQSCMMLSDAQGYLQTAPPGMHFSWTCDRMGGALIFHCWAKVSGKWDGSRAE